MKSLKDYSLNLPEQQYHDLDAWSYSTIAKYARNGFSAIATLHDKFKSTPEMEFGSLFDSFITKGKKTLDDYAVADFSVPPAEKGVLDALAKNCTCTQFFDISVNEVINVAESMRYQPNYKPQTRYDKIAKYADYYDTLMSGKKLVSKADWDDAMEMYRVFREDEYLKTIFCTKSTKDVEYIYQPQFLVDYKTKSHGIVKVKCMFDLLIVDHIFMTIQPVDLKTSSMPAHEFADHFVKMRYDIQGDEYRDVLQIVISKIPEYQDYTILPFLFTDISRTDKVPVTYIYPETGLSFTKGDKTYTYKRWNELLEEIIEYEDSNAVTPFYISVKGPNNLIEILER